MTFTAFRNTCTQPTSGVIVFQSFIEAREFAHQHPEMIETEFEADSLQEAYDRTYAEYEETRDIYTEAIVGDIY